MFNCAFCGSCRHSGSAAYDTGVISGMFTSTVVAGVDDDDVVTVAGVADVVVAALFD